MDQKPEDNWFYSRNGERNGPVPLVELQELVASGALDPLSDLAWQPGMPGWKSIGEIVALFKKSDSSQTANTPTTPAASQPKPEPRPEPKPEPARSSSSKAGAFEPMEGYDEPETKKPTEPQPGAGRFGYIFFTIIFPILAMAGAGIAAAFLKKSTGDQTTVQMIVAGVSLISSLLSLIYFLRRLTNLGMSWWWFFAAFVPLLNLWLGYRCFACPAEYAEHQKLDGVGIFLAIIYWLSILLALVGMVFLVIAVIAAAADPTAHGPVQDMLREILTQMTPPTPP